MEFDAESNMSQQPAWQILRSTEYGKKKPTMKPGLTNAIKAAWLKFTLPHQY
jgi:hypothetical protein